MFLAKRNQSCALADHLVFWSCLLFCSKMNTQKINCQEQTHQQSYGLIGDFSFDFTDCSNQSLGGSQQPWSQMGTTNCIQQSPDLSPAAKSSISSVMSRFKSQTSSFYGSEHFTGFDSHFANTTTTTTTTHPPMSSQVSRTCESQMFPSYQSSEGTFSIGSSAQSDPNINMRNSLQSVVKSHDFCTNQYFGSYEKLSKLPRTCDSQNKSLGDHDHDVSVARQILSSYIEEQDERVFVGLYNSPHAQLGQEKHSPMFSSGGASNIVGSVSTGVSCKTRIRWTQELHEKFVECVNRLGGAEKATPKAILKLMDSDGLTIFHVKSHLQKYRIAKYVPDKAEGRSDRRTSMNNLAQLDGRSGLQIREALQLQLDVQRKLHEQLEIQRNLQLRIEEQGKQLRMMFDQQHQTNISSAKNHDQNSQ